MLSKPACIGMCILDLSKVLIYKSHHDYINNKYCKTEAYYLSIQAV